jgi:hypothetical protein
VCLDCIKSPTLSKESKYAGADRARGTILKRKKCSAFNWLGRVSRGYRGVLRAADHRRPLGQAIAGAGRGLSLGGRRPFSKRRALRSFCVSSLVLTVYGLQLSTYYLCSDLIGVAARLEFGTG